VEVTLEDFDGCAS